MIGYQGPGRYRHYKGGEYQAVGLALHESELYRLVIYRPLTPGSKLDGSPVTFWARPQHDFDASVTVDGVSVARFERIGDADPLDGQQPVTFEQWRAWADGALICFTGDQMRQTIADMGQQVSILHRVREELRSALADADTDDVQLSARQLLAVAFDDDNVTG